MTALRARLVRAGRENWLTWLIVAVLVVGFLALRTTPSEIASVEAFQASLIGERPTIVYFYANT